ncbi:MAG: hypothetical protein ACTSW1_13665, partial [Candidatus Hodarchaeales archaeon]
QMSFEGSSYLQMTNYHFKSFYSFNQSHLLPSHSYGKTGNKYIKDTFYIKEREVAKILIIISDASYPFFLLSLAFIRILGGIVFLDFYNKYRKTRFMVLTIAFSLFALNPFLQFGMPSLKLMLSHASTYSPEIPLIFIASEVITTIAVYLFVMVFYNYSVEINKKYALIGSIIVVIPIILLYPFVDFTIIFYITQSMDLVLLISIVPYIIKYRRELSEIASNVPLFFLSNLGIAIVNLLVTLPIFDFEMIPVIELLTRIGMSFMTPFVFIHLEYNLIALEKFKLKDKYSHNLAQILQMSALRLYMINKKTEKSDELQLQLDALESDHDKINELLTLIRSI